MTFEEWWKGNREFEVQHRWISIDKESNETALRGEWGENKEYLDGLIKDWNWRHGAVTTSKIETREVDNERTKNKCRESWQAAQASQQERIAALERKNKELDDYISIQCDVWKENMLAGENILKQHIAEWKKKYARAVKMMIYTSCEDCHNYGCDGVCDEFIWGDFIASDANFNADNTLKTDEDKALEYKDLEERGKEDE